MTDARQHVIPAITLAPGRAEALALVLQEPLSFWGGLDAASGKIVDRRHPQAGQSIAGRILMMRAGRGSSSGSSVLAEAIRSATGPAGIVLLTRDAIVTVGAMVAGELYGRCCPVVLVEPAHWSQLAEAACVSIAAEDHRAEITFETVRPTVGVGSS